METSEKELNEEAFDKEKDSGKESKINKKDCNCEEVKYNEEMDLQKILDNIGKQEEQKNTIIQYRIIYNHGVMTGDEASIDNIEIHDKGMRGQKSETQELLNDDRVLGKWIADYYETYPMALMIACAVFNRMPYTWVVDAATSLYVVFGKRKEEEERGYAMTDLLKQFGAVICMGELNTNNGKISIEVVQLVQEDYKEKILKSIWRECPQAREKIVSWLKGYGVRGRISMAKCAMEIMGNLAYWDYYYFLQNVFHKVQSEKSISTDMMVARILISLNEHAEYCANVTNLMLGWNKQKGVHYLLTNLLVCTELQGKEEILEAAIEHYVYNVMNGIRARSENEYIQRMYDFFALGMRAFSFYRILIEKVYDMVSEGVNAQERENVAQLFLRLLAIDIDLARYHDGEDAILIRLCFAKHEIRYKLCYLWQVLWQCRYYRQEFYDLMGKYVKKIEETEETDKLKFFIRKALEDVCTEEMQEDICRKIRRRSENG